MERIRRKRFLARIKSPERSALIREILRHECGREFQSALSMWAGKSSPPIPSPAPFPRSGEPSCRCTVVINTVDRAVDLAQTLTSLREHWDEAQDELIIVLGPTSDESEEIIRASAMPCRLIHCPVRNLAVSRNLGWQAANGWHLAFIDDDASPAADWLDSLLTPLEQDPQAGVCAGFVMDGQGTRFLNRYVVADTLGRAFWFADAAEAQAKIGTLGAQRSFLTATGCNMAFRRSALDAIGGFDPFYAYFLEETDAVLRALAAGFRCVISPESRVLHRLGSNLARKPSFELDQRIVVIRSQIHYIGKFGKPTFSAAEIESCLWERALLDLEKIAWDCGHPADLQRRYLQAVAEEFRLDSTPESSSFPAPPAVQTHALS